MKSYLLAFTLLPILLILNYNICSGQDTALNRIKEQHRHPPALPLFPQYPEGREALAKFIKEHTKYPKEAMKHHISGTVEVDFTVKTTGELTNIRVHNPIGYGCDSEAVRIVRLMHKWIPSRMGRETIEMDFHVDVPFGKN
jgi:TonB family protein